MAMTNYNPGQVMMGNRGSDAIVSGVYGGGNNPSRPYPPLGGPAPKKPYLPTQPMQDKPQPQSNVLGSQTVRATGQGPYDPAYRQNLATYAGWLSSRPGGNLSFNPTSPNGMPGNPTGGGNAPVMGGPTGLIDQALGGNPFSFNQPPPQQPAHISNAWKFWLQNFNDPMNFMRGARNSY